MHDSSRLASHWLDRGRRAAASLSYVAVAVCIGMTGCGDGGGGGGGDDGESVRLAVGARSDDPQQPPKAVILRNTGTGWEPVAANLDSFSALTNPVFVSSNVAWAYGNGLVRSTDAGRTWEDVTAALPPGLRDGPYVLRALAFADASHGYLGAYRVDDRGAPLDGPFVWVTRNGGESWSAVDDVPVVPHEVGFTLAVRGGVTEMLRHQVAGGIGAIVASIAGTGLAPQTVATSAATFRNGFATVGERGWVAFSVGTDDDLTNARPIVLTSARPGDPWVEQTLPTSVLHDFGAIDMCDRRVGLAGGTRLVPDVSTTVFWTGDGGDTWETADLGDGAGTTLADVTCVREREMWAALTDATGRDGSLVISTDGGRHFASAPYPASDRTQIFGLASNRP